ncbi:glycosyltransferase [Photobacterium phosphoreum]|uniref:glycosyltransferase n=1 Tax=Photobacterium phosphoreum TaxID=659 RepID=UPI001E554117|nr:glycosyltransferase family A protein [Photobacterium phosphoreum]MCD9508916.1 glycosyltransferase [Photobacterium phosphoreum]
MNKEKIVSLILCTLGRDNEVKAFIDSIISNEKKIELIIVDQNTDNRVKNIIDNYIFNKNIKLVYIKTDSRGLSKARNIGLLRATGDIVGFPDDDCMYSVRLIDKICCIFETCDYDFISIKTQDPNFDYRSIVPCAQYHFEISMRNRTGCSITYFFKRDEEFKKCFFDELMGVGSGTYYGSGEETDFLINLLYIGKKGAYFPDVIVYHNALGDSDSKIDKDRMLSYGGGYAYNIRKNKKKLGFLLSLKLILAIPFKLLKSVLKFNMLCNSLYFLKGTMYGFFR